MTMWINKNSPIGDNFSKFLKRKRLHVDHNLCKSNWNFFSRLLSRQKNFTRNLKFYENLECAINEPEMKTNWQVLPSLNSKSSKTLSKSIANFSIAPSMLATPIPISFNKHSYPTSDNGKHDSINSNRPCKAYDVTLEFSSGCSWKKHRDVRTYKNTMTDIRYVRDALNPRTSILQRITVITRNGRVTLLR